MIKANELRIGNLVYEPGEDFNEGGRFLDGTKEIVTIESILEFEVNIDVSNCEIVGSLKTDDIEPILLSEEWLQKFGFKNPKHSEDDTSNHYMMNGLSFGCWNGGKDVRFTGILDGKKLKYVHELQNLYFCLTGVELVQNDR